MLEVWKDIPEYVGLYQISNTGKIKSFPRHGASNVEKILKQSKDSSGYPIICLTKDSKRCTRAIHRILAEVFITNPENKEEVNHIDGDKCNCILENLEWVTKKENMAHAVINGLHTRGETHSSAKLTEKAVLAIRGLYASGKYTYKNIALMFSVSAPTIQGVINRRYWNFV
jgi:hypothetical protein